MKRACELGKWFVTLDGKEVFRDYARGPAVAYASSLSLVSVFDRQKVAIAVFGPAGKVWCYEEEVEGVEMVCQATDQPALEVAFLRRFSQPA